MAGGDDTKEKNLLAEEDPHSSNGYFEKNLFEISLNRAKKNYQQSLSSANPNQNTIFTERKRIKEQGKWHLIK
jgi:hypothetical protein